MPLFGWGLLGLQLNDLGVGRGGKKKLRQVKSSQFLSPQGSNPRPLYSPSLLVKNGVYYAEAEREVWEVLSRENGMKFKSRGCWQPGACCSTV